MKTTILTLAAATLLGAFTTQTLEAATFSYDGLVTITEGPAVTPDDPDLPPLGTAGMVELVIDDSDPTLSIFNGFNVAEVFSVSVDVPGFVSGSMDNNPDPSDFFSITAEYLAFGAYGPTAIVDPGTAVILPSARHSFRIDFGAALSDVPTTIGEVVAALNIPGASGYFSHELEGSPGFIFTRVAFEPSPVPLPASAWLLLAALGSVGMAKRRRS